MYRLKKMSGEKAKKLLKDFLTNLSWIEPEDMTTFELRILHQCAENPPKQHYGIEQEMMNASK